MNAVASALLAIPASSLTSTPEVKAFGPTPLTTTARQALVGGKLRHGGDELVHQRAIERVETAGIVEQRVSDPALRPFIEANVNQSII
jgi:hypothetical protein